MIMGEIKSGIVTIGLTNAAARRFSWKISTAARVPSSISPTIAPMENLTVFHMLFMATASPNIRV